MQILYINSDSISARQLHAEFLSYRGFVWDLTHCQSRNEAIKQLDCSQYDVVLYESVAESQLIKSDLEQLITHFAPAPVVALVRDFDSAQELQLMSVGVHDTITERYIDGSYIMRRMRMALARVARQTSRNQADADETLLSAVDTADQRPLRLLIVEAEKSFHDLGAELGKLVDQVEIETTDCLQEAELILDARLSEFDGVLVGQGAVENQEVERLKKIRQQIHQLPFIMLILDRSDFTAVSCIEQGFSDCIVASYGTTKEVLSAVRKSLGRMAWQRRLFQSTTGALNSADHNQLSELENELPVSDRRTAPRLGSNRRRNARFLIERPIMAYAVLPDGGPDYDNIYEAESIDFSVGGIGFKIPLLDRLPGRNWLIGVLPDDRDSNDGHASSQRVRYANVILRHIKYESDGIQIGSKFQADHDLFDDASLAPTVDSRTNQVKYGLSREILDQWVALNVLSRQITQRAKACPDCHAIVSVGDGCCQCGSAKLDFRVLIHHFACAYVDDSHQFQTDGGISCPKCLSSGLIVGADFELIKSRYRCEDCGNEGSETTSVCACFHCLLRFPLRLAREVEVYRYDVQRLDVLDILDSTKRMGALVAAPVPV
jgi:DNA-binding NarL/FixJ family response regulator